MFIDMFFSFFSIPPVPPVGTEEFKNVVNISFFLTLGVILYIAFAPKKINPFFFEMKDNLEPDNKKEEE